MASIQRRGKKYCVVYRYQDEEGNVHQKWETFDNQKDADKRKKEVDYKIALGQFEVPKCVKVKELLDEYVKIYGHNKWGVSTYDGNMALINNYIIPTIGDVKLSDINKSIKNTKDREQCTKSVHSKIGCFMSEGAKTGAG